MEVKEIRQKETILRMQTGTHIHIINLEDRVYSTMNNFMPINFKTEKIFKYIGKNRKLYCKPK